MTGVDHPVPTPTTYGNLGGNGCNHDYGVQGISVTVSDGPISVSPVVWKEYQP